MSLEKAREYQQNRKWYQLSKEIISLSASKSNTDELRCILEQCINQIHPISLSEACIALSYNLATVDAINIINAGLKSINDTTIYFGDFKIPKIALQIRNGLLNIELGNLKHIERCIYEFKGMKLPQSVNIMYNLLGYTFYSNVNNIDEAFNYLYSYIKEVGDGSLVEKLILNSLLSHSFYNFSLVSALRVFNDCSNAKLKELFLNFAEGKTDAVEKSSEYLTFLFGDESNAVKEKVYMVALTDLCFSCNEKMISYDIIEQRLGIDFETACYFTLKAMGLGLVSGWIDGRNKMLYLNSVMPRNLSVAEISKMKDKFSEWRVRVNQIIGMLD